MAESLRSIIDQTKTINDIDLKNKSFSNETISSGTLACSNFQNVSFININFENISLSESFFSNCFFQNCNFNNTRATNSHYNGCTFDCCYLKDVNLKETIFNKCGFIKSSIHKGENGILTNSSFESCHFNETMFKDFDIISMMASLIIDCQFSKHNKMIEFKGYFGLNDLLLPKNGILDAFEF